MIAYVVTSGSYSDYSINSVFSSKKKAQAYIDKQRCTDYEIEEYDVDADEYVELQTTWEYALNAETGDFYSWRGGYVPGHEWRRDSLETPFRSRVISYTSHKYGSLKPVLVFISTSTVSHNHAVKVAVEAHQLYLRTGIVPPQA